MSIANYSIHCICNDKLKQVSTMTSFPFQFNYTRVRLTYEGTNLQGSKLVCDWRHKNKADTLKLYLRFTYIFRCDKPYALSCALTVISIILGTFCLAKLQWGESIITEGSPHIVHGNQSCIWSVRVYNSHYHTHAYTLSNCLHTEQCLHMRIHLYMYIRSTAWPQTQISVTIKDIKRSLKQ